MANTALLVSDPKLVRETIDTALGITEQLLESDRFCLETAQLKQELELLRVLVVPYSKIGDNTNGGN